MTNVNRFWGVVCLLLAGMATPALAYNGELRADVEGEMEASLQRTIVAGEATVMEHEVEMNATGKRLAQTDGVAPISYRLENAQAAFTHRRTGLTFERLDSAEVRRVLLRAVMEVQMALAEDETLRAGLSRVVIEPAFQEDSDDDAKITLEGTKPGEPAVLHVRLVRNAFMCAFASWKGGAYAAEIDSAWGEFNVQTDEPSQAYGQATEARPGKFEGRYVGGKL